MSFIPQHTYTLIFIAFFVSSIPINKTLKGFKKFGHKIQVKIDVESAWGLK